MGGVRNPRVAERTDETLTQLAQSTLRRYTGLEGPVRAVHIHRVQSAIPQFVKGHREILDRVAPRPTLLYTVTEYRPAWAEVNEVVRATGERYEIVVDFSADAGSTLRLMSYPGPDSPGFPIVEIVVDPDIEVVLPGWNPNGGPADHDVVVGDTYIRNVTTDIRSTRRLDMKVRVLGK